MYWTSVAIRESESEIRGESIKILIAALCVHSLPIYYSFYLEGSMQDDPFSFRPLPANSCSHKL